jgi:hypothetical protein
MRLLSGNVEGFAGLSIMQAMKSSIEPYSKSNVLALM